MVESQVGGRVPVPGVLRPYSLSDDSNGPVDTITLFGSGSVRGSH